MGVIAKARRKVFADITRSNTVANRLHPIEIKVGESRLAYIVARTLLRGV